VRAALEQGQGERTGLCGVTGTLTGTAAAGNGLSSKMAEANDADKVLKSDGSESFDGALSRLEGIGVDVFGTTEETESDRAHPDRHD
jgi:hypothetical protein